MWSACACAIRTYLRSRGSSPTFFMPPTINSSELYGKIVSIRMIPSVVVNAHDEWTLPPTKYRLSKTFAGSAYQLFRGGALEGSVTYAGTTSEVFSPPL